MIDIDGSEGEGGGQMLRTATALSALTGKAVRVHGIRANRPKPGLAAQHLCAVRGVAMICGAHAEGAEVGSTQITFTPGEVRPGKYKLNVGTAGSITLVLQACLLASARCLEEIRLDIVGGTNVRWSPPIDFYQRLLFPRLADLGFQAEMVQMRRGFYPEGGGRVEVCFQAPEGRSRWRLASGGDCWAWRASASRRTCPSMYAKGSLPLSGKGCWAIRPSSHLPGARGRPLGRGSS